MCTALWRVSQSPHPGVLEQVSGQGVGFGPEIGYVGRVQDSGLCPRVWGRELLKEEPCLGQLSHDPGAGGNSHFPCGSKWCQDWGKGDLWQHPRDCRNSPSLHLPAASRLPTLSVEEAVAPSPTQPPKSRREPWTVQQAGASERRGLWVAGGWGHSLQREAGLAAGGW